MPVLAPAGEFLSFASPSLMDVANAENAGAIFCKRKKPKKRRPYAAYFLRSSILTRVVKRDSLPL
ncbi:hypothetical protein [Methyloglobulus morosus]|uniref:hypothetical protein n=1 Tax=Methyloglobulus morosus TaxID=1410681 RepID=UPI000569B4F1|nr:hypothetical protein [Methyloglobulus morosus]